MGEKQTETCQYEVLHPCADADPPVLRAPSARLSTIERKTIGLFANFKRAARPIQEELQRCLSERFPSARFARYNSRQVIGAESEGEDKTRFDRWCGQIDAALVAVGDCST